MEDANNAEDEDAHSDQRDGRQQHTVARGQVQLSAPTGERIGERERKREGDKTLAICPFI